MSKDYYIYNEYNNFCGRYEIRTNITKVFETIEELFKYMEDRKRFWNSFDNTRTIKIDIVRE